MPSCRLDLCQELNTSNRDWEPSTDNAHIMHTGPLLILSQTHLLSLPQSHALTLPFHILSLCPNHMLSLGFQSHALTLSQSHSLTLPQSHPLPLPILGIIPLDCTCPLSIPWPIGAGSSAVKDMSREDSHYSICKLDQLNPNPISK
jgi:hypothetical protein